MKPQTTNHKPQRNPKFEFGISRSGFTLIELLIVIVIIGLLSTLVTVNFQRQRQNQELQAAVNDVLSKIREAQSNILGGKIQPGETAAAAAYELTFAAGTGTYQIDYFIGAARKPLETVRTLQNTQVQQILKQGAPDSSTALRLTAPYGAITADGDSNQNVQITLQHAKSGQTRTVVIDGISGRISAQ